MSPLDGLLMVDASTLFAGPMAAMHLGDRGAALRGRHPPTDLPFR